MNLVACRWLDSLQREISGAAHRYPATVAAAWKENAAQEGKPNQKQQPVDYALGFDAAAHLSNSRRAFGDALNRLPVGGKDKVDSVLAQTSPFLNL